MGPNTAFCFFAAGLAGVHSELIWPGRMWPGVAGLGAALAGGYWLWQASPVPLGLGVLTVALLLFLLDAFAETLNIAGISATAAMALGFARLLAGPHRLQPVLAIPACLGFGAITLVLNRAAKQARRNKLADLHGERKGRACAPPNK